MCGSLFCLFSVLFRRFWRGLEGFGQGDWGEFDGSSSHTEVRGEFHFHIGGCAISFVLYILDTLDDTANLPILDNRNQIHFHGNRNHHGTVCGNDVLLVAAAAGGDSVGLVVQKQLIVVADQPCHAVGGVLRFHIHIAADGEVHPLDGIQRLGEVGEGQVAWAADIAEIDACPRHVAHACHGKLAVQQIGELENATAAEGDDAAA